MSQELALTLVTLVCSSCVVTAALVPFTAEVITPSKTMREHRRRLRRFGAPGTLAEKLLPRFLDGGSPLRVWGALYALAWLGLLITFGALIRDSEPKDFVNNLVVVTIIVGAWWSVQFVVVILSRVLIRVNDPTRQRALQQRAAEMAALEMPGKRTFRRECRQLLAAGCAAWPFCVDPHIRFLGVCAFGGGCD